MNSAHIVIILFVFVVFLEILHFCERNRLENKIMSRDYNDYSKNSNKTNKKEPYKTEYEKLEEEWNSTN